MKKSSKKKSIDNIKYSKDITKKIMEDYSINQENKEEKSKENNKWEKVDTVIIKKYNNFQPGDKLIAFDLDDTLIDQKDGKKFQYKESFPNDWKTIYDKKKMNEKLEEYKSKNYIFAVFSNQSIISSGQIREDLFKERIDNIFNEAFKFPFIFLAATTKDYNRKPSIGMFEIFENKYNNNIKIDKDNSYYIGDAAGREKTKKKKKDFSDSDYKFSINCKLKFLTPEEFFLNEKVNIPKIKEDYHIYDKNNNNHIKYSNEQEMIILIGSPGSGKSTFCENFLVPKGYVRINLDTLKTKQKCFQKTIEAIKNNKSVVIDNTNPQKSKREEFINIAMENKIKIRAFIMKVDKDLAIHLNNLRVINNNRNHFSESVNMIPIHSFYKNYEEPKTNEGFDEIVNVNFVPGPFENEKDKEIFYMLS